MITPVFSGDDILALSFAPAPAFFMRAFQARRLKASLLIHNKKTVPAKRM